MKRALPLLFLLTLVIIGGLSIRERWALQTLSLEAEENAHAVSSAYAMIVETKLLPLTATGEVDAFLPNVEFAASTSDILQGDLSIDEHLQYISRLQLALWDVVESTNATDGIIAIKKSIENHSPVTQLLDTYNTTALRWNRAQESRWQSWSARLTGMEEKQLPFLRYDGRQEFVPIIQL